MKVKLLKKLRKIFIIQERNGKFKAFDNRACLGGVYNQTDWVDRQTAMRKRRKWILREARNYKVPKKVLK